MQRIIPVSWTPEQYLAQEAHRLVVPESICPNCQTPSSLHVHGSYPRWFLTVLGVYLRLRIARFFCPQCLTTISYLPNFFFSYRYLGPASFAAFLDGDHNRPDVLRFGARLGAFAARLAAFAPELIRTVGSGLGLAPPLGPEGVWPWLKKAGDSLATVTRQLVGTFRVGLFQRYQCHQPTGL